MKLNARIVPYSSIVGGGLMLEDYKGHAKFQLHLSGTVSGITKQQNDEICAQLMALINETHILVEP